jgi:hypothetical protein
MEPIHEPKNTETKQMNAQIPCETAHDFALILDGISDIDDDIADALGNAGCDDCTISVRAGRVSLTFTRVAESMKHAIVSAIQDVRKANIGATVLRIDDCNLVTPSEIGRKTNRSRQHVHQYMTGERGPGGFPPPACHISGKSPLWRWCEVAYWLWQNGIIKESALRDAQTIEAINSVLEYSYQRHLHPDLVLDLVSDLCSSDPTPC